MQWLVTHNKYYRALHIIIDVNTLAQLPQDGNLTHLTSITVDSSNSIDHRFSADCSTSDIPSANSPTSDSTDSYDSHFPQLCVPIATRSMMEQEAVQHSLLQRQLPLPLLI